MDKPYPQQRHINMAAIREKNTKLEMMRKELLMKEIRNYTI